MTGVICRFVQIGLEMTLIGSFRFVLPNADHRVAISFDQYDWTGYGQQATPEALLQSPEVTAYAKVSAHLRANINQDELSH